MNFDPNNPIVKLCAKGVSLEGKPEEASRLFVQAWNEATNDAEKFIAAHYLARHQRSVEDKLKWDETALDLALNINDDSANAAYPSLYLNIAKCYEDLGKVEQARKNYDLALSFAHVLPDDGYGKMIRAGIYSGIERVKP
jgi:tetratricopeptide (TPR) repeat protein